MTHFKTLSHKNYNYPSANLIKGKIKLNLSLKIVLLKKIVLSLFNVGWYYLGTHDYRNLSQGICTCL